MLSILFIGHLGADGVYNEERKETNFSVAVDLGKDKDGNPRTRWIYCHLVGDFVFMLSKGSRVYIEGIPRTTFRKNADDVDIFWHVDVYKLQRV